MAWVKQDKVTSVAEVEGWGGLAWGSGAWGSPTDDYYYKRIKASDSWTKQTKAEE